MKKITVISIPGFILQDGTELAPNLVTRLPLDLATMLIAKGSHRPTTKGKLKCFLNRNLRLMKNSKTLEEVVFPNVKDENIRYRGSYGKIYGHVKMIRNKPAISPSGYTHRQMFVLDFGS